MEQWSDPYTKLTLIMYSTLLRYTLTLHGTIHDQGVSIG